MPQPTKTSPPPEQGAHSMSRDDQSDEVKSSDKKWKEQAAQAIDDAKSGARRTAETVTSEAASMGEDIQSAAADVAQEAKREGHDFLDRQKERAADEVSHFEAAIRRAAKTLRDEDDDNLANYADRAAARLSSVKSYLRRQELGDLLHDVEESARRRPELVFGGLLVAGLAAARFLKASSRTRSDRRQPRSRVTQSRTRDRVEYASAHQPSLNAEPVYETRQRGAVRNSAIGSHES